MIRAAREAASSLRNAAGPRPLSGALLNAFVVDHDGMIKPAPKRTALFHNYEARMRHMLEQHGRWGQRPPHGLRAMPAPWSEVLQTSQLILPEEMTEIVFFGPDVSRINRPGQLQRHLMHGYMILRDAIHAAVDKAPIMMKADLWIRLLDHRGWKSLWGDVRDNDPVQRANTEQIRALFERYVKNAAGEFPQPWAEAKYNGRVYNAIAIEIDAEPAVAMSSDPAPNDSKRTRRAKKKARERQQQQGAQNVESPGRKVIQKLEDVPDADWDYLLWEMIEINHQGELRSLHFLFHADLFHAGVNMAQVNEHIMTSLGRGPVPATARFADRSGGLSPGIDSLAGVTPERRRRSIVLLLGLMNTWKIHGVPFFSWHPHLQEYFDGIKAQPPRIPGFDGFASLEEQEVAVLHQWARMFVEKFGRAPTAPRLCPTLEMR